MSRGRRKVGVVGSGNIGNIAGYLLAQKNVDFAFIDLDHAASGGKALDISQAGFAGGFNVDATGGLDYSTLNGSDVVIITSGLPRKDGQSRSELLKVNAKIIKSVTEQVIENTEDPVLIYVANPVDSMAKLGQVVSKLPPEKVIGMAPLLDSSRFAQRLGKKLNVHIDDIVAPVLGGHGDNMVPLVRFTTVGGLSLEHWVANGKITQGDVDDIVEKTRKGGGEIVKLFKEKGGSAFNAPPACAVKMAMSIIDDERRVIGACVNYSGDYGGVNIPKNTYVGLPVILGKNGVEGIVEYPLNYEERTMLYNSVVDVSVDRESLYDLGFMLEGS